MVEGKDRGLVGRSTAVGFAVVAIALVGLVGCGAKPEAEVLLYSNQPREFVGPLLSSFHRGVEGKVQPTTEFEVAGNDERLVDQLIATKDRPVADLFWDTGMLDTIRLQKAGVLEPHRWRVEPGYPPGMRASDGTWCGFAARARVLLVNTEALPDPSQWPTSVDELADPKWRGRCALANPIGANPIGANPIGANPIGANSGNGTATMHAAVIRLLKGDADAAKWFEAISKNAVVLPDNMAVAVAVSSGRVEWGLTDSDIAVIERDRLRPVEIRFPDQESNQPGTLRIPSTLSIVRGAPHPKAAALLADFLISGKIEDRLAMGDSAQLPLSRDATHRPRVLGDRPVRWMKVDFEKAADAWDGFAAKNLSEWPGGPPPVEAARP
jgi:iron(III) transport system substrate-binding protein